MPDQGPIEFQNADDVIRVLGALEQRFADDKSLVGMAVLAVVCRAVVTLAQEVKALKESQGWQG